MQAPPNLLILDVHMPARSGFSVLERMQTIPELEHIPVILITGDLSTETMLTADRFRIDFVIEKPFSGEDLVAHVRAALSQNIINQR